MNFMIKAGFSLPFARKGTFVRANRTDSRGSWGMPTKALQPGNHRVCF